MHVLNMYVLQWETKIHKCTLYSEQQKKVVLSLFELFLQKNEMKLKNNRVKTKSKRNKLIMIDHLIVLIAHVQWP